MPTRLKMLALVGCFVALVVTLLVAQPASAACIYCPPGVETTDAGLLARARSQMAEVNAYVSSPPTCDDEHESRPDDGNDTVEHVGFIQWRLSAVDQTTWDDMYGSDFGTMFRLECYLPGVDGEYGSLIELQEFDAINPQILAQVAIDEALARIPTQQIRSSPAAESLVAIDTWFWVEGVPAGGVSATASVPGMSVTASATPGGVSYDFGDGTGRYCLGQGVPWSPGAASDCTHAYQVASRYTVASTIVWTGTFTINGSGPYPIQTGVARTDSFVLPVMEAQAINKAR